MYEITLDQAFFPAQTDEVIKEISIGELLREVSSVHTDNTALVEVTVEGQLARHWTYTELLKESESLSYALASRFKQGERIAIWAPNIPEWVIMEYACALAGLVLVTVNPAFQAKELRYVLEQSKAVALFLVDSYRGNPMAEIAQEVTKSLSNIREIIDLNNKIELYSVQETVIKLPIVKASDAAQIQYTSGTTGFPKGAVLSHQGLVNNARFYAKRCGVTQDSIWINIMPMFHTSGCGMVTLGCLQAGCKMILVSLFEPETINSLIESEKATIILGVPTMIRALLEAYDATPKHSNSLQLVSCGGSTVPPEMVRRVQEAFGSDFSTLYGQTEHCPVITQHHINDSIEDICNTIGQPLSQTDVSIRRVVDNTVAALGEVGEICARSISTMICYNDNEVATAETIDSEGWLHTGDLGKMDSRGYVTITGRVKEMIIRGGENHFPAEIENLLLEHPSVAEVAVVGLPDEKWGEVIAAFIRTEGDTELDVDTLHKFCREHISPQKTPSIWQKVDSFPLTGSGKIRKFELKTQYLGSK